MKKNINIWIIINILILISISLGIWFTYSYFDTQKKLNEKINIQKVSKTKISYKNTNDLSKIKTINQSINYLESIDSDISLTFKNKKINYKKENSKKSSYKVKKGYIPKVLLDKNITNEFSEELLNNNINRIAISSPISTNKNIEEKWSENTENNKEIKSFLKEYSKKGEITLILSQKYNSIMNVSMPEILRVKLISNIIKRYNIHNIIIDWNQEIKKINYEKFSSSLYILQTYLKRQEYDLSYNFTIYANNKGLLDNEEIKIKDYLRKNLNINSFIIRTENNSNLYSYDPTYDLTKSISKVKKNIQKLIIDIKSITLNDKSINSLISYSPVISNSQINAFTLKDAKNLVKIFKDYSLNTIYLDNINSDFHLNNKIKSLYNNGEFTNEFMKLNKKNLIDREDIFKIFRIDEVESNKIVKNITSINTINEEIPNFIWKTYLVGEKVQYRNHIFEYKDLPNVVITLPKLGDKSNKTQWKDLGARKKEKVKTDEKVIVKEY